MKRKILLFLGWLGAIAVGLALIGGAASWYFAVKYRPIIVKELKTLVRKSTNGLYTVDFSHLHINFLTGNASISNVVLTPDTEVYQRLVVLEKAPNNIYKLQLKKLVVRRFHPLAMLMDRKLTVNKLLFDSPTLEMLNKQYEFNEDIPPRPRQSPYQFISKFFSGLNIGEINLTNVRFRYIDNNQAVPEIHEVANLNIYFKDYLIDAESANDPSRFYLFKDVRINVNNYSYLTHDKMYRIGLDDLSFNAVGGKLNINAMYLQPMFSESEFGRKAGYSRDRFEIKMNDVSMTGLSLHRYIKKREIFASAMQIANGTLAVFSDNSLPGKVTDKTGRFPHQLLQKLGAPITIDTIDLNNVDISYSEFDRDSRQRGVITFDKTSGRILNATNERKRKLNAPIMTATLKTHLMARGALTVNFNFDLTARNGAFSYNGLLKEMDGRAMNKITKPLGMVEINRAKVKEMSFNITANDKQATGKMAFAFNDLSVNVLKKNAENNKLVKQGLISFLANNLILYSDNPSADGKFTRAKIRYTRPVTASFFSFIWRTLFDGIKHSVGVTPETEAKVRAQIARFEQLRSDIQDRKEARERRRAKRAESRN